jgi:prepilin-type N-terminal cleavage/methylation domain-containing protein
VAKTKQHGFTIIEILIVLAIAGLILLIVFFAVPALQRSARNARRKRDLGRFYAAVQEYAANRNSQRAPFPGDDSDANAGDTSTDAEDLVSFDNFKANLDPSFSIYQIPWILGGSEPHDRPVAEDEILYFALHYCNRSGTTDLVEGSTHNRAIYSVAIGLEPNDRYCLDNGDE